MNPENRFWMYVDKKSDDECWEWLGSHSQRYGLFRLGNIRMSAHRYSYFLFTNHFPKSNEYICHKCDNPFCVNPHHLFLGTQFDNMQDMVRKGRNPDHKGEKNSNHKLSEIDVMGIRTMRSSGAKYTEILKKYPISQSQLGRIANFESWIDGST